jgi:L-alanine-DL-glutamate epimerase-like enolase superfamily enzyme
VLSMACGAVINAVWDLWSRSENKPLWEMVVVSTAAPPRCPAALLCLGNAACP